MASPESLADWYVRLRDEAPVGSVTAYDRVPPACDWQADPASGKIARADGRFRSAIITHIDDPLQEVPSYDAPVFLELGGPGLVLNITRETVDGMQMLLQFKGERAQRYVTTSVQASYGNLGSNKVALADVATRGELFEHVQDIEQAQDIALALSGTDLVDGKIVSPKCNFLSVRQLHDADTDVHAMIAEKDRHRFRWSAKAEIADLRGRARFAVSSHLCQWLGAYT